MYHRHIVRDGASALLHEILELCRTKAALLEHRSWHWNSATFNGLRHEILLEFTGHDAIERGEWLCQILPEHEFRIAGHIVADLTVADKVYQGSSPAILTLKIHALTVEDLP